MATEKTKAALDSLLAEFEPHQVAALLETARVRRAATRERELRPEVMLECSAGEHAECRRHALRPLDPGVDAVNADLICLDVIEALKSGSHSEQYFHLIRLFRCVVAQQPHLEREWQAAVSAAAGKA